MNLRTTIVLSLFVTVLPTAKARADDEYDRPPINYRTAKLDDPIARLQAKLDSGQTHLERDPRHGYLNALLKALKIPISSQTLVFSKTSFQARLISPQHPRAVYFSDDAYVGFVQGSDTLEVASTDPQLGTVFYTFNQMQGERPRFVRQTDNCLQCHESALTRNVPGLVIRSVFPDRTGQPVLTAGTYITTHQSPFARRWGGWYVSGIHGNQRHMGNAMLSGDDPDALDRDSASNVTELDKLFDTAPYLAPHSDIVALMVLGHQAEAHNLIERANYLARITLRDEAALNEALKEHPTGHSASTLSRIRHAGEPLVKYMLFSGEPALTEPVEGSSGFTSEFPTKGPRDHLGRSLRDFDLQTRLFKYPCSYLIYSEGFDALPDDVRLYVYERLWAVLTGKDTSEDFAHLTPESRKAISEILVETKKGLPAYWAK